MLNPGTGFHITPLLRHAVHLQASCLQLEWVSHPSLNVSDGEDVHM